MTIPKEKVSTVNKNSFALHRALEQAAALDGSVQRRGDHERVCANVLVYHGDPLSRRLLRNRLLFLGVSVMAGRGRAHFLSILDQRLGRGGQFDLIIAAFSEAEVRSGTMQGLLEEIRGRTSGPILAVSPGAQHAGSRALVNDPCILWRDTAALQLDAGAGAPTVARPSGDPRAGSARPRAGEPTGGGSSGAMARDEAFRWKMEEALAEEVRAVESAARGANWTELAERAHRLNGLAAYAGCRELQGSAAALERGARHGDARAVGDGLSRLRACAGQAL